MLTSERYSQLLDRLRALVADPPWTAKADKCIRGAYRRRIENELGRLERRIDAVGDRGLAPDTRNKALHEARKAAKRARYAVEPVRPVYGAPAEKLVKRLKKLQSRFGQHQDTVVTRGYLHDLTRSGRSPLDPAAALVAGALIERESRDAEQYERKAAAAWRKVAVAASLPR